jgi:hypothetical protein
MRFDFNHEPPLATFRTCGVREAWIAFARLLTYLVVIVTCAVIASAQTTFVCCGGGSGGAGINSVAFTTPSHLTGSGSVVDTTLNLTLALETQLQGRIFAAPCSATGAPTFRVLCATDLPAHASSHGAAGSDPVTIAASQLSDGSSGTGAFARVGGPTFTAAALFAAGTAAAPGIAWSADADASGTGLYRPAANQIGVSLNGALVWQWGTGGIGHLIPNGDGFFDIGINVTNRARHIYAAGDVWASQHVLSGTTSGSLTLKAPAVAGTNIITFPAGTTDFSATGGAEQYVKQASAGGAFTVGAIAATDLPDTAVTPGAYTSANITVDQQGRITLAANGGGGAALDAANTFTRGQTIDGTVNESQLLAQGHSTQTSPIIEAQTSTGDRRFSVEAGGVLLGSDAGLYWSNVPNAGTIATNGHVSIVRVSSGRARVSDGAGAANATVQLDSGRFWATATDWTAFFLSSATGQVSWSDTSLRRSAAGRLSIADTGTAARDIGVSHVIFEGTDATLVADGNCGTSPVIAGKDGAGRVTLGTGSPTACTVTFNRAYPLAPACSCNNETTGSNCWAVPTTANVIVKPGVGGAFVAGDVVSYACSGF